MKKMFDKATKIGNNAILLNAESGIIKFAHNGSVQIFADGKENMRGCISVTGSGYDSETEDDLITVTEVEEYVFSGVTKVVRGVDASLELDTDINDGTIRVWVAPKQIPLPRETRPVDTTWTAINVM